MIRLFAVAAVILMLCACSKEPEKPSAPPVSQEKSMVEELREQTVRDPNDAEAWYHLADVYERDEMYREEVDALKKAVALKPDNGSAYLKLGSAYSRLGQYEDAVKNLA